MLVRKDFYDRSALKVAREMLGCFLVRRIGEKIYRTRIVETEAYEGFDDLASHASRGKTPRNAVMFGHPGIFYVYFTYGMHHMLNVVTGPENHPAAVLIRAIEPLSDDLVNTHGPARLTKALKIDKKLNGLPAFSKKSGLWIEVGAPVAEKDIVAAKRVGVDYAGEYKDKLWRFYVRGNPHVSKK